jgi:hypothetical protein
MLLAGCGRLGFDALGRIADGAVGGPNDSNDPGDSGGMGGADAAVVPAGPAIWLRMETDPTVAIIDSGGGHAASCTGGCPQPTAAGKHGRGFTFNASQIDISPAADLDSSAGFSAGIWVNLTQVPASRACFWTKAFNNAKGYDTFTVCVDPSGASVFDCETQGGTAIEETGPTLAPGTWHHLASVWDGSNKHDYFDGVDVGGGSFPIGAGNQGLALGGARGAYFVQGTFDDAIYYTRALSAAEIAQLAAP